MYTIPSVRKAGHLTIKTKMLDFEARVLIGRLANTLARQPIRTRASKFFCFCVNVACLSYGGYGIDNNEVYYIV